MMTPEWINEQSEEPDFFKEALLETLLFLVSLLILRVQIGLHLSLSHSEMADAGLYVGAIYDLFIALIVMGFASICSGLLLFNRFFVLAALMVLCWLGSAANVLHFCFFEQKLYLWIVTKHIGNLSELREIVGSMLKSPLILVSINLIGAAFFLVFRKAFEYPIFETELKDSEERWKAVRHGILLVAATLLLKQAPVWFRVQNPYQGSAIADQILMDWWDLWVNSGQGVLAGDVFGNSRKVSAGPLKSSKQLLGEYRDGMSVPSRGIANQFKQGHESRHFEASNIRVNLGLDPKKPINVIALFVESARAYELLHPTVSPRVFPRMRHILDSHGMLFTQAYSSARVTVNGQFSALCSYLPNLLGTDIYIANENLKISCIQEVLKENGFRTLWFHSNDKHFLNKHAFESKHGTEQFYDVDFYRNLGIRERVGDCKWGVADGPFLKASLEELERISKDGKPFFANVLTISTHMPFNEMVPDGKLPPDLLDETKPAPEYQAFLSRWRYADGALGDFFERFFKSPIADNTVVFLLGDHGLNIRPYPPLADNLQPELWSRIAFAVITKKMKHPTRIPMQIHQMDLAPSIASLTGVPTPSSWLGRSVFSAHDSLWVGLSDGQVAYRDRDSACYPKTGGRATCFDVSQGEDPLFEKNLKSIPENIARTAFFQSVLLAVKGFVEMNLVNHLPGGLR